MSILRVHFFIIYIICYMKLTIKNSSSQFEDLVFSKAHSIWCVQREFDYLHKIISKQSKEAPKKVEYASTGVKGNVKQTVPVSENIDDFQKVLRDRLSKVLDRDRNNQFLRNLARWRGDYTEKQAYWINKYFEDKFGRPKPEEKNIKNPITDEEANNPAWTPWD